MKLRKLAAGVAVVLAACAELPKQESLVPETAISESPAALPAGGKAIATFESLGLYWKPPGDPGPAGCPVRYRKAGEKAWKEGLPLWYDPRNGECRGSLVSLTPGTEYVVRLRMPDKPSSVELKARTWSEHFPVAKTIDVGDRTSMLEITEGGSPGAYVLYKGGTIDVGEAQPFNIRIAAPYVIVRGFKLKGAQQDAVRIEDNAHDVVIEDNDISGWGRFRRVNYVGWKIGMNMDSGIAAYCRNGPKLERIVIQRNRIHDPRYGANSWSEGHPAGPNGIMFSQCGGNHVFRYNELYSADERHYFMDAIGGEENLSDIGFPNRDSDIYGNIVSDAWDDAIESEGANRNVRIWGNYLDRTTTGVATTVAQEGPVYIFRNVYNRSRQFVNRPPDEDERNVFAKSGTTPEWGGGRRYIFHNTLLQAPAEAGGRFPLGAGGAIHGSGRGEPVTNTVSRNNIFQIWKPHWDVLSNTGRDNDFGYDLYNGKISTAEGHGIFGTPVYASGNGAASGPGGRYQLAPGSPGYDAGARIPNFNDDYRGRAPDIGAAEAGAPPMRFGLAAGEKARQSAAAASSADAR
jgi:hypothetical protein